MFEILSRHNCHDIMKSNKSCVKIAFIVLSINNKFHLARILTDFAVFEPFAFGWLPNIVEIS